MKTCALAIRAVTRTRAVVDLGENDGEIRQRAAARERGGGSAAGARVIVEGRLWGAVCASIRHSRPNWLWGSAMVVRSPAGEHLRLGA